jgi:hypothetical protein
VRHDSRKGAHSTQAGAQGLRTSSGRLSNCSFLARKPGRNWVLSSPRTAREPKKNLRNLKRSRQHDDEQDEHHFFESSYHPLTRVTIHIWFLIR